VATRAAASRRTSNHAPQPAYVLHHHDWSESSLIVELFTRELGRIVVVAKGAKRPHSQLRAVLLPLQPIAVLLGQRKNPADDSAEVQLLRSAEWAGGAALPSGSALMSGFYLNELLLRALARHDPHPELWDAYAATLPLLAAGDETSAASRRATAADGAGSAEPSTPTFLSDAGGRLAGALRAFELLLLRTTGLLPEFDRVTLTQAALDLHDPAARYQLRAEAGLVDSRHLRPEPGLSDAIDAGTGLVASLCLAIEAALQAGDIVALQTACQGAPGEIKQQLRRTLHYHFGDRALRTRQVMQGIQHLLGS
jgi:DNA repair protein RecO (recombination protein O)